MAERPHYFGSWCVLFTDAVCLAGAYCLVGTAGSDTMVALSLPIWIVWMSVCYGLLALFLRRRARPGSLQLLPVCSMQQALPWFCQTPFFPVSPACSLAWSFCWSHRYAPSFY